MDVEKCGGAVETSGFGVGVVDNLFVELLAVSEWEEKGEY